MNAKIQIRLILSLVLIAMLSSFKAPLVDMRYQIRNCRIDSIKSANDRYFIYASNSDTIYEIISNENHVEPEKKGNASVGTGDKLIVGEYYKLSLCPTFEYKRTASGFMVEPQGWHGVEFLDNITVVEREIERGILNLYYCENIKGSRLNDVFARRDRMAGQHGIYNGIYCDSSMVNIIEIRDSILDFYVKDCYAIKKYSDFGYLLTLSCKAESLAGDKYVLYPLPYTIFNDAVVRYPEHGAPAKLLVFVDCQGESWYDITLIYPVFHKGKVEIETKKLRPENGLNTYEFPENATLFSMVFSAYIDGISYNIAYPGTIEISGGTIMLDFSIANGFLIENSFEKESEVIITYDYIEYNGLRYERYRPEKGMLKNI